MLTKQKTHMETRGGGVLVWEYLSSGERQKKKLEPDLNRPDCLFQNRHSPKGKGYLGPGKAVHRGE